MLGGIGGSGAELQPFPSVGPLEALRRCSFFFTGARSSIRATEMDSGGRDVVDWLHELGYSWVSWIFEKFTYVDLVEAVMVGVGLRPWRT